MRLSLKNIIALCEKNNKSIASVLRDAGVSRNAFYSLARKASVVPRSITAVAAQLGVSVFALLEDTPSDRERIDSIRKETERIVQEYSVVDPDTVRHTLIVLDEDPFDRLRRALRRGRQIDIR